MTLLSSIERNPRAVREQVTAIRGGVEEMVKLLDDLADQCDWWEKGIDPQEIKGKRVLTEENIVIGRKDGWWKGIAKIGDTEYQMKDGSAFVVSEKDGSVARVPSEVANA
tara:strand:- start:38 stop:367 length:330 start_codon:yes stop_codon:yes gene_type:complete